MKVMDGISMDEQNEPDVIGEYGFVRIGTNANERYLLRETPTIEKTSDGKYKIGGFEKMPTLYICDPEKNVDCKKTFCQDLCWHTTNEKFKKEG